MESVKLIISRWLLNELTVRGHISEVSASEIGQRLILYGLSETDSVGELKKDNFIGGE